MTRRSKNVICVIVILAVLAALILGVLLRVNRFEDNINFKSKSEELVDNITSGDIKNMDEEERIRSIREMENLLIDSSDDDKLINARFVLAYFNIEDGYLKEAIEHLEEAKKHINDDTDKTLKAWINYQLSKAYLYDEKYDKSDRLFNEVVEICKVESDEITLIEFYRERSMTIIDTPGGVKKSIELIDKSTELAEKNNYNMAIVYSSAGTAYAIAGEYITSIEYQLDAIEHCKEENLKNMEIRNYIEIAINYMELQNYDEAIKYLKEMLEISSESEDAFLKTYALVNLCESYLKIGDAESAQKNINDIQKLVNSISDDDKRDDSITYVYALEAQVSLARKNVQNAIEFIELAERRYNENAGTFSYIDFDILIEETYGDIYYEIEQYDKALEYHKNAQKLAVEKGSSYYDGVHAKKIYSDYLAVEDYENATKYMNKYIEAQSKVKYNQDRQYTEYLHKQFETEKNREIISRLEVSKKIMRVIILCTILIIIIIAAMTVHIYMKNREINKLNTLFKNLSITDSLTGIPNRRALDEYLAGNWALYRKTQMPISFVMIDIDCFKNYNDNYGHPMGDLVLEKVSKEIKSSCRNSDFVARYGGEEFTIIMLNTDKEEALNVADRIKENVHNLNIKHEFSEISDRITISMGISTAYVGTNKDYDEYIKKADKALYKAKNNGRNNYIHLD